MSKIKILPVATLLFLASCAPKNMETMDQTSQQLASAIGCENYQDKTFRALQTYLLEHGDAPSAEELKLSLKKSLKSVKGPEDKLKPAAIETLSVKVNELVDLLLVEAPQSEKIETSEDLLALLSALKTGDQTTENRARLLKKIETKFGEVNTLAERSEVACQTPEETPSAQPDASALAETTALSLPVYGARLAVATAYQTCDSLDEPVMTWSTPDVRGISRTGTRPDGGGIRVVSNAAALVKSQPYYKNVNAYDAKCVDMRSTPLIYDFGGKPAVSSKSNSTLNFFKSAGTGTKALGFDCSAFVYSSIVSAGLRFTPNKNPEAIDIFGYGASRFANPEGNRMTCFKKISVTPQANLQAGDIVATSGHIVMIDSVGADPFGINSIRSLSSCSSVSYRNFDFVIAQSSPSKNGIGVNRFYARDYLPENSTMRSTLEAYAKAACQARLGNKTYTPSTSKSAVIRHTQSSSCLGTRIALENEACVKSCSQLRR